LDISVQARTREAPDGLSDFFRGRHLNPQVVQRTHDAAASTGRVLDQDQLERRLGDGEVGIAGLALGRFGTEELRVEVHSGVNIRDVESELYAGHVGPPLALTVVDVLSIFDTFIFVNGRPAVAKTSSTLTLKAKGADASAECCPSVLSSPLDATEAARLALGFTALADPVRLQVLSILAASSEGEVCVCDFVEPLGKSQPTISHHMKVLADAGLVHGERRSKWVYYSLDRARLASLRAAIDS